MATNAKAWKQANRKDVTLPSGRVVTLRKLTSEFILVMQEINEDLAKLGLDPEPVLDSTGRPKLNDNGKPLQRLKVPASHQKKYVELLLLETVYEPKLVPHGQVPADDEMHVADFGADLDPLVIEVHKMNGDVLELPFRASEDGQADPPTGEGVRREPESVAPEAAPGSVV